MAILCVLSPAILVAQPPTPSVILGGSGNIGFSLKNDESDAATFTMAFKPNVGFMFNQKWSLHASYGQVYNYLNYINLQDKKRYIYNKMFLQFQLSSRRYFMISEKFGFYIEPQILSYIKVVDKQNIEGVRKNQLKYQKQFSFSFGAEPGLIFFPKEDISIDCGIGGIGYTLDIEKWSVNTKLKHTFSTFIQPVGVSVGVRKYFIPKSKS